MLLFPTYDYQSSSSTTMASFQFDGPRPKGLWKKVRGTQQPRLANPLTTTIVVNTPVNTVKSNENQEDIASGDVSESTSTSSKRRLASSSPPPSEEIRVAPVLYWDYSHICNTHPVRLNKWKMGAKFLDTSAIIGPGQAPSNITSFSLEDWKDLRDLATEAKNIYDGKFFRRMIFPIRCSPS